jgi:hypothetical protein
MKLQYLGDSRDAFKWDLLHWICTTSPFSKLVFVPLLTSDIRGSNEGLIPHHRFRCKLFIRPFLDSLKEEPRSLNRIENLGKIDPTRTFEVSVFAPEREIGTGTKRTEYWSGFDASMFHSSVIFFDPDNGYETKTQRGAKWIEHDELKTLFASLPETSVALIYQHRPRRIWSQLFADLAKNITYVKTSVAVYESTLAFVAMASNVTAGQQIALAMESYSRNHTEVKFTSLFNLETERP